MSVCWEPIGAGLAVPTDEHCRFTEDAVLLATFAAPTPDDAACDLGAGSGILPLLWCRRHPPRHITAVEREAAFVALLTEAVTRYSLTDRVTVVHTDWRETAAMPPAHSMTLVTCNPPYFRFGSSRTGDDPLKTAARHEDHPDLLPTLCREAARLLTPDGRFCLCHRPERLADVFAALQAASLTPRRLQFVQTREGAAPWLFLCEAGFRGTLRVSAPLVSQSRGDHTAVYRRLYR